MSIRNTVVEEEEMVELLLESGGGGGGVDDVVGDINRNIDGFLLNNI